MWNDKAIKPFLIVYISFLLLATFFMIPTLTSFYYYAWGKQLAWSYFDGPPMIAYIFDVSHAIFGNTYFSINIVGFFCLLVGSFYIYKTGCLLQDKRTGLICALIWAVLPTTTESVFVRVLYDAPLNLFTILSLYYFARHIVEKRPLDLYLCAFFIGAMILSKYTAAVSIFSILLYILFSKQRQLFKQVHFYLASLVILIMASPVLYWNASHHWESIIYLLSFHSQSQSHTTVVGSILALLVALIINYSVFLFFTVQGWLNYQQATKTAQENNLAFEFICYVLFISLAFWLVATLLGGESRTIYLTPLGINIALASGYCITRYDYDRFFKMIYPLFLLISVVSIIANAWPVATYLKKGMSYAVIDSALRQPELLKKGQPITTGFYTTASALSFFMPSEPIYTLPCGDSNQYQYWSESFLNDLFNGKIEKITYVDFRDTKQCANRFFNQCKATATLSYNKMIPVIHKLTKPVHLYVYECSSPRTDKSQVNNAPYFQQF